MKPQIESPELNTAYKVMYRQSMAVDRERAKLGQLQLDGKVLKLGDPSSIIYVDETPLSLAMGNRDKVVSRSHHPKSLLVGPRAVNVGKYIGPPEEAPPDGVRPRRWKLLGRAVGPVEWLAHFIPPCLPPV